MVSFHRCGVEWTVDALGCRPDRLRDRDALQALFDAVVRDLDLHPVRRASWHRFPGTGGLTGLLMLKESHLACHTFPEFGSVCLNLFCCRPRPAWAWRVRLAALLGATRVTVKVLRREYGIDAAEVSA